MKRKFVDRKKELYQTRFRNLIELLEKADEVVDSQSGEKPEGFFYDNGTREIDDIIDYMIRLEELAHTKETVRKKEGMKKGDR